MPLAARKSKFDPQNSKKKIKFEVMFYAMHISVPRAKALGPTALFGLMKMDSDICWFLQAASYVFHHF